MYEEALQVLQDAPKGHPMPYYVIAGLYDKMGEQQNIAGLLEKAEALDTKYCFPSRLEELRMLEAVSYTHLDVYKRQERTWICPRQPKD